MNAIAITELRNYFAHRKFWGSVLALDAPHVLASLSTGKSIHDEIIKLLL
jgi:hypothetical protein